MDALDIFLNDGAPENVNNGEKVPVFNGFRVPLFGCFLQGQRRRNRAKTGGRYRRYSSVIVELDLPVSDETIRMVLKAMEAV